MKRGTTSIISRSTMRPLELWQRMPAYFYLSPEGGHETADAILAYTHDDRYKEMPGFKVLVSHFHMHFNEQLTDAGSMDVQPSWLQVFRGLGIDIAILADFHSDSHPNDPGPLRFKEQQVYFEGCKRFSDRNFLLIPGEEPDATLGGHYITFLPHPVYWSHVREAGQQFEGNEPPYGKVYHVGSPAEELDMLRREQGLMWQAHPRTKGSAGYPDAVRDKAHFLSDRFLGGSYQSLPVDQSQQRHLRSAMPGPARRDEQLGRGPEVHDRRGRHVHEISGRRNVSAVDRELREARSRAEIHGGLGRDREGDARRRLLCVERRSACCGTGRSAGNAYTAEVEWTFPLEFVELVWGDGKTTGRQIVRATELGPMGSHRFQIPFDAAGKKWVRFAAWDSAGNGAFTQPAVLSK